MSDVYNPEAQLYEELGALELEARGLASRRAKIRQSKDRRGLDLQLRRIEALITRLRRRVIRRRTKP